MDREARVSPLEWDQTVPFAAPAATDTLTRALTIISVYLAAADSLCTAKQSVDRQKLRHAIACMKEEVTRAAGLIPDRRES